VPGVERGGNSRGEKKKNTLPNPHRRSVKTSRTREIMWKIRNWDGEYRSTKWEGGGGKNLGSVRRKDRESGGCWPEMRGQSRRAVHERKGRAQQIQGDHILREGRT